MNSPYNDRTLGLVMQKLITKNINNEGIHLVEDTQNNWFSDGLAKWAFKIKFDSPMHNTQQWRHAVGVVDGFFCHLDIEDKQLFWYPISLLAGKEGDTPHNNHKYFIRILKVFSIKPKL